MYLQVFNWLHSFTLNLFGFSRLVDSGSQNDTQSTIERFRMEFKGKGYDLPKVVFQNDPQTYYMTITIDGTHTRYTSKMPVSDNQGPQWNESLYFESVSELSAVTMKFYAERRWLPSKLVGRIDSKASDIINETRSNPVVFLVHDTNVESGSPRVDLLADCKNSSPEPCKCLNPDTKVKVKNLVICIDGTSNQYSDKNTNVIELYSLLKKDDTEQVTYYNSGIGTYAKPSWRSFNYWKQVVDNKIDLAIAWNFESILLKAYRWLSDNYKPGDRIYLFGFSRGAYQVRALAGMINKVGLIHKGNEEQIPFAYELYADEESTDKKIKAFKNTFSRKDVKVHFIGVWDTVSSVGLVRTKNLPDTASGLDHVCHFRHALALDERRVKFMPEYAHGGTTLREGAVNQSLSSSSSTRPHTKEVWFPGTHSDIGGGNVPNPDLDLGSAPLQWMLYEALAVGLLLEDKTTRTVINTKAITVHESLSRIWWILEVLPIKRLSYSNADDATKRPHMGEGRCIQPGQKIHVSILQSTKGYTPKAIISMSNYQWEDILPTLGEDSIQSHSETSLWAQLKEDDIWARANVIMERFDMIKNPDFDWSSITTLRAVMDDLRTLSDSEDGGRAISEVVGVGKRLLFVMDRMLSDMHSPDALDFIFIILQALSNVSDMQSIRPQHELLAPMLKIPSNSLTEQRVSVLGKVVERSYGNQNIFLGTGQVHKRLISSVAFSPGGDRIISGSWDDTIRVWDSVTGAPVLEPLTGHSRDVNSVAYSPDGQLIVSGSSDCTIRLWNAETGEPIRKSFKGHTSWVRSVAFSRDGKFIVSGSGDGIICVWNSQTGERVSEPFKGHTEPVWSVAVSPDGTRIVSGSYDNTILIWDSQTGMCVLGPLEGHMDAVSSVAYSPDGRHIVSGSWDSTIRIWEADTGKLVSEFKGHTISVMSVAYAPDGEHIASGSYDNTIRVWDTNTGVTVLGPLEGHTGWVMSVAYSQDGACIVSGDTRGAIRVWDARTGARVNPYEWPHDNSKPETSREERKGKRAAALVEALVV